MRRSSLPIPCLFFPPILPAAGSGKGRHGRRPEIALFLEFVVISYTLSAARMEYENVTNPRKQGTAKKSGHNFVFFSFL